MPDDHVATKDPPEAAKKLVNLILLQSIKDQATEIHFNPGEDRPSLYYRVKGEMHEMMPPPPDLFPLMVHRVKYMANLQDTSPPRTGRIMLSVNNREFVAALSTFATPHGERAELTLSPG